MKIRLGPVWISSSYMTVHNTSYDGITFEYESNQILYGTFFFMAEQKAVHHRNVYNFIDLLSELGGIFTAIFGVLNLVGNYINTQYFMSKIISDM